MYPRTTEVRHTRSLILVAVACLLPAACAHAPRPRTGGSKTPDPDPDPEALFARTKRIEIVIHLENSSTCPPTKPYVIRDPRAIATVLRGVTVKPTGTAAGWMTPNVITFHLDDGHKITTGISGYEELFGVHLPGQDSSRDCVLTRELVRVIGPHLDRAIAHYKRACPGGEVPLGANGRYPSAEELKKH
jgi:hypothetical protein